MPTIVLRPHYEIIISDEQEEEVLKFIESDDYAITVNGTTITKPSIAYIKPGGYTQPDVHKEIIDPSRRLKTDNRTEEEQHAAARKKAESLREIVKNRDWSKLKHNQKGIK